MKVKIAVCIPVFSSAKNIETCIDSLIKSNNNYYDLNILLYNNSNKKDIIKTCKYYANNLDCVQLFDFRYNRGCSITWNDAIEYVYFSNSNEYACLIIVNDDIEFLENSFIEFVDAILKNPRVPVLTMSPIKDADHYSLFSYSRFAYEKVGYFDENIRPAYFEDADFINRIRISKFEEKSVDLKLNHHGSASIPNNNLRWEFDNIHLPRTKDYYKKKWNNPQLHTGFPVNNTWPFERSEEKFYIDYSQRKKPHKYFSTVKDLPKAYEKFEEIKVTKSDIYQHLEKVFQLTLGCNIAVCLGLARGEAAFALALSCNKVFVLDENPSSEIETIVSEYFTNKFKVLRQNTHEPIEFDEIDVLFIDSIHTAETVKNELIAHAHKVKKYIIFHDTYTFGNIGEDGGEGILEPIANFMLENEEWKVISTENINNGMIILAK